jgi:phosphate transport system protein
LSIERASDREFDELRALAIRMGALSEEILSKALRSVFRTDVGLAAEVMKDDLEIDRLDVAIDEVILRLLALRAPVASDLRAVLATKSLATDLERVGDIARNIAGNGTRLASLAAVELPQSLRDLADDSQRLLRGALDSFADGDADHARRVIEEDDRIDEGEARVLAEMLEAIPTTPEHAEQRVNFMFIATSLERVGDHATNIAEDVILAAEALNVKHAGKLAT